LPHFTLPVQQTGPVLNAGIMPTQGRRDALVAAGEALPAPQPIRALVDTGASFSSVDPQVLISLGLTPTGNIGIVTPSTGAELFHAQGIHALIGRDILARCTVFYNGALSQFTISF